MTLLYDTSHNLESFNNIKSANLCDTDDKSISDKCQQVLPLIFFDGKSKEISINCDTEYFDEFNTRKNKFDKKIITCQFRESSPQSSAKLYTHSDMRLESDLPSEINDEDLKGLIDLQPLATDLPAVLHYLADIAKASIEIIPVAGKKRDKEKKSLTLNLHGHFLIVDFQAIFQYTHNCINSQIISAFKKGNLEYSKNLSSEYTFSKKESEKNTRLNFIPIYGIEIKITQNGQEYFFNLNIKFTDTFGRLGPVSYKNFAKSIGYDLPFKNLIDDSDKSDMLSVFKNDTENFIRYSLGDCESSFMIDKTNELFAQISHNLNIQKTDTRPTIGGTVNRIIQNFLTFQLGNNDTYLDRLTHTANNLKNFDGTTKILLSMIFGGRCFSNNHIARIISTIIIDVDFEGAYNSVLNAIGFNFYLGNPDIYSIPIKCPRDIRNRKSFDFSKGVTLRKFLNEHQSKFVPFGYQIVVCSKSNNMKINQDLLCSKYNMQISHNKDLDNDYLKEKTGTTKIFVNDVFNAVICHSSLELILADSDKNTVSYLLDNLIVVAGSWYDKDKQCHHVSELNDDNWYAIPISKLSSKIRALRECYDKKHPLNTLYKLLANTCYGVLASPYFDVSNPIVANNITDTVRVACYLLEKTFNCVKSITDGGQVDINNIIVNRQKYQSININNSVRLNTCTNRELHDKQLKTTTLLDSEWSCEYIDNDYKLTNLSDGTTYNKKGINQLLLDILVKGRENLPLFSTHIIKSQNSLEGLQDDFLCEVNGKKYFYNPIERKGIIAIEIKSVNTEMVGHGSANYLLWDINPNIDIVNKYRSYKSSGYYSINSDLEMSPCETPASTFSRAVMYNPSSVKRSNIFLKKQILLPNQYLAIPEKWNKLGYKIGDSIPVIGYLLEFSISLFQFNNFDDYNLVNNEVNTLKVKYGQSFEMWFINPDGTLNYELMVNTIVKIIPILNGKKLSFYLNKIKKLTDSDKYHPRYHEKLVIKEKFFLPWSEYKECQKSKKISQEFSWASLFSDDNDSPDLGLVNDGPSLFDDLF